MPRPRTWLIVAAICLLLGVILWLGVPQPSPLWSGAIAVEATRGWIVADTIASGYDHVPRRAPAWFWRSESQLTCLQPTGTSTIDWIDLDLATGHATPPSPTRMLQPDPPDAELFYWCASPDGRWFLQVARHRRERIYSTFSMEGTFHRAWTNFYESNTHPEWLSNSSGFVEWPIRDGQLLVRVHWLDTGHSVEIQLNELPGIASSSPNPLPQPFVPLTKWPLAPGIAAEFLVLDPVDNPAAWHRRILALPEQLADYSDVRVVPAPTGEHLAWLAHARSKIPIVRPAPDFPFLRFEPKHRTTLLLSRPDGTDLRVIGRTPAGQTIERLQWSPASSRVSFLYAEQLWVQPVPRRE